MGTQGSRPAHKDNRKKRQNSRCIEKEEMIYILNKNIFSISEVKD